jgi:hypothetical protein
LSCNRCSTVSITPDVEATWSSVVLSYGPVAVGCNATTVQTSELTVRRCQMSNWLRQKTIETAKKR